MTQEEILEYNKRCALFLGWKETSEQFKIDWVGCKTKERLDKIDKEYIPILEKDGDVLFPDFSMINFHSDWNWIMEILTKIKPLVCEAEFTNRVGLSLRELQKEKVIEGINQFLIWYNENN